MLTSLDLLVIVFMAFAALMLLSVSLMFLIKNKIAQRVFFYATAVLGILLSLASFLIGFSGYFPIQIAVSLLTAGLSAAAIVLSIVGRKQNMTFLIAKLMSVQALVIGLINVLN